MSQNREVTKSDVVKVLMIMSEIYDKAFTPAAAELMVSDLTVYGHAQVIEALAKCRRELRTFPTVAEIVARIPGQAVDFKTEGILVAAKILEAVTKFGSYRVEEARKHVGELGWGVIAMSGGWNQICQMTEKEIGIFRAQWAQLAEALLKRGPVEERPKQIEASSRVRAMLNMPKMPKEDEK